MLVIYLQDYREKLNLWVRFHIFQEEHICGHSWNIVRIIFQNLMKIGECEKSRGQLYPIVLILLRIYPHRFKNDEKMQCYSTKFQGMLTHMVYLRN